MVDAVYEKKFVFVNLTKAEHSSLELGRDLADAEVSAINTVEGLYESIDRKNELDEEFKWK